MPKAPGCSLKKKRRHSLKKSGAAETILDRSASAAGHYANPHLTDQRQLPAGW